MLRNRIMKCYIAESIFNKSIFLLVGSCSQGWVALKNSCYRISKESKPWNIAQQYCKLSLSSAHLVDIKNEEEKKFVFSHLRSKNQIIIWTGLNDFKVSRYKEYVL